VGGFLEAQVGDQFLVFLVVENDAAARVEQGESHGRRIDDRFDQVLLIADQAFEAVHLGNVAVHADKMRGLARGIDDRGNAQFGQV